MPNEKNKRIVIKVYKGILTKQEAIEHLAKLILEKSEKFNEG